ncbi:uncharacterized protein LOC126910806 [Spodoptera frugiperda]|uniref:Uncharacterized protein LOC126910806 n=1 Tax=Spodoptera frugiperda TaxID=7108 RepID=A0A9R0DNT3_SPOFR|nr:uncharacterized protein LOC126910806 [Spodoptera frugiperda]
MKYLGLVLDSRWNFGPHLRQLVLKLRGAAAALSRLLPNLGNPNTSCRWLYMGIVRSMALYGSPVWADGLTAPNIALLRSSQRAMAIRVIRGYRTISFEAASLLAGSPPWDLEAKALASLYRWRGELAARGERYPPRVLEARRTELRCDTITEWKTRLAQPSAGHAIIAAVSPVMEAWIGRGHGVLTFRLTQVLSGHGCFGKYLCRIGREQTSVCHHCDGGLEDTARHTLEECSAWAEPRRELIAVLGGTDLSMSTVIQAMVDSESAWDGVASFCEQVMLAKEAAERRGNQDLFPPAVDAPIVSAVRRQPIYDLHRRGLRATD